jgi:alkylglycerol monooxygenase
VLPWIGFPATMITSILLVHGLYPFFIHTKTIGKLGPLEFFLVTPSHHRVHHASNPQYLDKNYGDVFIIWDKLFGTFKKEGVEEISYGLTKPLRSYSFLWQHFHFPIELLFAARRERGWHNKLKIFFNRPDKLDPSIFPKDDRSMEGPLNRYVVWQMVMMIGTLFFFILLEKNIPLVHQLFIGVLILITLINCGAIMEQKTWIVYLEYIRLTVAGLSLVLLTPSHWLALSILLILLGLIAHYSTYIQSRYLRLVYTTG